MFLILLILIFIRPFISSAAFPYVNFIYSILVSLILIIWLIRAGIDLDKIQPLKYPIILFLLALFISLAFSFDRLTSLKVLCTQYINAILIFLVSASLSSQNKSRLINCIVIAGFIVSLLAIYQYFFGFRHLFSYVQKHGITDFFTLDYISRKRVFLPFVTPNALAGYLILIIPLALTQKYRILYIVALSSALLLTRSLGGLLSIFLATFIYFVLQGKIKKRQILFLAGLLAVIALIFITRGMAKKEHLTPLFSTLMRLGYWKDTLKIIQAHPLTGVGLGNFNLAQSRFAHNSYLQLWAEMGIAGLVAFLWFVYKSLKIGLVQLKEKNQHLFFAGLFVAGLAFLLHNLLDFSFFLPEISLLWWVILGLFVFS